VRPPRQSLHIKRVGADDIALGQLVQAGDQCVGLVDHAGLAEPALAVVGDQLYKGQLPPRGAHHHRIHLDDPHG
jgi:hypothetical protein